MYGKQMELFGDGGLYEEGGMVDEVSGNDVPPGSTRKEVRDDIPAMLSEGEFVFPADVVRYFGLERLMEMRQQAKMGLQKMEAMGQMGNSEEATIPDDLPFSPEDLIIMSPQEFNRGGVVKAQQGVFVQPSGFEDSSLNTPNFIPPSSVAPVNPQGTPTGYLPSFVNQSVIQPTGQTETTTTTSGTTGTTTSTDTDFVPTVNDVYTFEKYKNESTGEIRDFPFYMGEPVIPIPDGFVPYSEEETTATEDVTDTGVETTQVLERGDGGGFDPTTGEPTGQQATPVGDLSNADLMSNLSQVQTIARAGTVIGTAVNPALGAVVGVATKARYNDLLEEAQRRGLDTDGQGRMGSIFGGEASLYSGLQDINDDGKISFADTWMGDLLGLDGKAGVQGPNLQDSRKGARRGATTPTTSRTGRTTTSTSPSSSSPSPSTPSVSASSGGGGGAPSTPGSTAANAPGATVSLGGQSVSVGYGAGQVDPGLAAAAAAAERGGNDDSGTSGGGRGGGTSSGTSGGTSSGSASPGASGAGAPGVAGDGTGAGPGGTDAVGPMAKGGLATRKQNTVKRSVDKNRGVAARKKK